ncbi:MAG TPA: hypothetical protein VNR88_11590 [Hyphomicrobium sp.]|nr:hypothetical protein [Hyphomicrobium sp.]
MLPKGSAFIIAAAAAVLLVHSCILLGGGQLAVVLCIIALMIAGPIAILAWLGMSPDLEERARNRLHETALERADALLWQRTLAAEESSPSIRTYVSPPPVRVAELQRSPRSRQLQPTRVADAFALLAREGKRFARPILALWVTVASAVGLAGCGGVPPEAWMAVRPGMNTAELVSLVGGPDYVRTNGTAEVWQYCRDFPGRDQGSNARYYTAILVDKQVIKDVRPLPVLSDAGCQDFYRANF